MTAKVRTCPHCGTAIESEIPAGWIKVPLEMWNELVEKADRNDRMVELARNLDKLARTMDAAAVVCTAAKVELAAALKGNAAGGTPAPRQEGEG